MLTKASLLYAKPEVLKAVSGAAACLQTHRICTQTFGCSAKQSKQAKLCVQNRRFCKGFASKEFVRKSKICKHSEAKAPFFHSFACKLRCCVATPQVATQPKESQSDLAVLANRRFARTASLACSASQSSRRFASEAVHTKASLL